MTVTCMIYWAVGALDKIRYVLYPQSYKALYTYAAEDDTQLTLMPGQRVKPLLKDSYEQWWFVKADSGKQGYVPAAYLTPCLD